MWLSANSGALDGVYTNSENIITFCKWEELDETNPSDEIIQYLWKSSREFIFQDK